MNSLRNYWFVNLLAMLLLISCSSLLLAQIELPEQGEYDSRIAMIVGGYLEGAHLTRRQIDDDMSKTLLEGFVKRFDPNKLYFTKDDYQEFAEFETLLDDHVHQGQLKAAYKIVGRFLQRLGERTELVKQLLKGQFDFDIDEVLVTDPDKIEYCVDDQEIRERWRKRVKYELLVLEINGTEYQEAVERVSRRYQNNARLWRQIDSHEILENFLGSLARSFDPHTDYMSKSTLEEFNIQMRLQLNGIGAELRQSDEYTEVVRILPGGAAFADGRLKKGDKIIGVGQGEHGEISDVVGMRIRNVVRKIRGKPGTTVRIEVLTGESQERKIYNLVRRTIKIEDHGARGVVIEQGMKEGGAPYKVGVVRLDSFYVDSKAAANRKKDYASTTRDVRRILEDFKSEKVDGVLVDLRRNGGGFLLEAISLTGLFIDRGPVVQVKDFEGKVTPYYDRDSGVTYSGPLVVLTSRLSASAAEIFAAAIQDYNRGIVVGDSTTHGKGTVQNLLDLAEAMRLPPSTLGALKLTLQKFYRINGDSTQTRGVRSDIVLPSLLDQLDVGEEHLDRALAFDRVVTAEFQPLELVNESIIKQLKDLSTERRSKDGEFVEVEDEIAEFLGRKGRSFVPLQKVKLREELKQDKSEDMSEDEQGEVSSERPVFERDFYSDEVLLITQDYIRLSD